MSLKIRNSIARNLEKMISLSLTLITVCSDKKMISCSLLFPICDLLSWYRLSSLLPDVVKLITQSFLYEKIWIKNTGYMSHYSAAQNEGKWSSRSSEKGEFFIIPQLKFFNILQPDPTFCKAEIFSSGWDLLGSFSVHKLQNQDSPSNKVCLPAKGGANASTLRGKSFADLWVINLLSTVPHCPICKTGCKRPLVLGSTLI